MAPLLFVIAIAALVLGTVLPYLLDYCHGTLLPDVISQHGRLVDDEIKLTFVVTGIFFTAAHLALAYFIVRYRDRGQQAKYITTKSTLTLIALIPVLFVFVEVIFNIMSQSVWAELHMKEAPKNAVRIEVNGQQFKWYFRYPGKDNTFGFRSPALVDDSSQNFLGVDFDHDAKAKDDIIAGTMKAPWDRPVLVLIRSRDVLHSFFVRELRLKQDAVPGLEIKIPFTIDKQGLFKFKLEGVAPADLDATRVPQAIRAQFAAHEIPLDKDAELSVVGTSGRRWELNNRVQSAYDPDKYFPVKYAILAENSQLNVYKATFEIFCAELCGQGHYSMRAVMEVLPPEEFDSWVKSESEASASYR